MSSVYGDYLDDLDFGGLAKLFAVKGNKEIPFSGFYVGRESIAKRDATAAPPGSRPRTTLPLHWRTQNVILVAADGRSASIRSRLFQPQSSRTRAMGFGAGMYHDQVVLENGVWKLWSVAIDEHYFSSPTYEGGWSSARAAQPAGQRQGGAPGGARAGGPAPGGPPAAGAAPGGQRAGGGAAPAGQRLGGAAGGAAGAAAQPNSYPPDIPLTQLGERERGFRGGTGESIAWPGILPMWFHYKNPVSGRVPPLYWPDCVPCVQYPETSMKNHGYLLPPS